MVHVNFPMHTVPAWELRILRGGLCPTVGSMYVGWHSKIQVFTVLYKVLIFWI